MKLTQQQKEKIKNLLIENICCFPNSLRDEIVEIIETPDETQTRQTKPTDGEIVRPTSSNLINPSLRMDKTAEIKYGCGKWMDRDCYRKCGDIYRGTDGIVLCKSCLTKLVGTK